MKDKPHSIRVEHPNTHGNTDAGCRINIEGLFPRPVTILERELPEPNRGFCYPLLIEDLTYLVQIDFSHLRLFKSPSHVRNRTDNVLGEPVMVPVEYHQAFVGDTRGLINALQHYCSLTYTRVREEHGQHGLLDEKQYIPREEGGERTFRTDLTRSFRRQDNERVGRRPLWLMEMLNHENFHGGYIYPDDGSDPYEESPWATLKHWHRSLNPVQWRRLLERINLMLLDGGYLQCHAGEDRRDEINFRWAGMFGALILRGDEFSSHT